MKLPAILARTPVWTRTLLVLAMALVGLYAALGFLVAPAIVQAQLPKALERALGRRATLQRVRINPFACSVTLEGFRIAAPDGGRWVGLDRLYVRLRPLALLTRTVSLRVVDCRGPYGEVALLRDGKLDCADVLQRLAAKPPAAVPPPRGRSWEVAVSHFAITDARLELQDHSQPEPFATTLGPVSLVLDGFRTRPDVHNPYAFSAVTEKGERLSWTGEFGLEPLQSAGTLALERLDLPKYHPYYQPQVQFHLRRGRVSARASYRFRWAPGDHVLALENGSAGIQYLELAGAGQGEPEVRLPSLEAQGIQADFLARSVSVASLRLKDGRLAVTREPDGSLDLARLLTPKPAPAPPGPPRPFRLALKELGLQNFQVRFLDRGTVRPVTALAEAVNLTLRDFSLDPGATAQLDLALRLNQKATLTAAGPVQLLKPAVDLQVRVEGLALPPWDPYLAPGLDIRLTGGTLATSGRLRGSYQGKPDDFTAFQGDLRVNAFEAMDGARREPFLRYKTFSLAGVDLRTSPTVLTIRQVDLDQPEGRLVLSADGGTNLARAFKLGPAPGTPGAVAGAALPPTQGPPISLNVAQVGLRGGRLSFIDRSLQPEAALLLTGLEGSYTSLSTRPDTPSTVTIQGLAGSAPVRIQGRAKVLRQDQDTDVTLEIQGSELTDFSAYAGKYLGYTVHKGKLGVDAHVRIQERRLDALFKTRLDQFYLGERTHSPDATHLPVKLALAILRDRHGVIDLELPVQGSLDAPDFHYGKIVWHAVLNLLGKAATSPFTLLAKLGGASDRDLSCVAFLPGSAEPDPGGAASLPALLKALEERPDLSLEAEGSADPVADGAALRRQALELRLAELRDGGAPPPAGPAGPMAPEERERWLNAAYLAAFPAPAASGGAKATPPPPAEMEQRLLATFPVPAEDLRRLADARAKFLIQYLMDAKVEPGRLFQVEGGERAMKDGGSRVYLGLR